MKIALALSGLPRLYTISTASWSRFIGQYNPDVYIHSWLNPDSDKASTTENLNYVYHPVAMTLDQLPNIDISAFPDRHWPYIDVYKSLSMWQSIWKVHQMIVDSGIDYDIIVRGRFDLYMKNFNINLFDGVTIPYCPWKFELQFNFMGAALYGVNDHMAYGPKKYMDIYANTGNEISQLYNSGVDYCPENFLTANLVKNNVPIKFQTMEHKLIRY